MPRALSESDLLILQIKRLGVLIGAALVAAGWWIYDLQIAACVLLGILLSTLNLDWMRAGLDRALRRPSQRSAIIDMGLFFLRLFLIMICLYVTLRVSFRDALACLAGFSVYVLGAMLVGVKLAYSSLGKHSRSPRDT